MVSIFFSEEEYAFVAAFTELEKSEVCRRAVRAQMEKYLVGYRNSVTFAIAKELHRNLAWQDIAKTCDSWQEMKAKLLELEITHTPSGVRLSDNRVNWRVLTMIMRDKYA